ncbi:MAG: choice-of-anchor O protein, partial [Gammaproteobacteria bacterium]|nr:choice-of-anchor O protein [Gammaproteobacteria bacterium]
GCNVTREDIPLFEGTDFAYPGDVVNVYQSTAGTNALVVWLSRYCDSGSPNYSLANSNPEKLLAIADYMGIDLGLDVLNPANPSPDDLYLIDMFGVGGQQGSIDYSEDTFEPNRVVGEVPFNCLWAARGTLVQGDDPRTLDITESSFLRWFRAERLTSGRRDANRIESDCVAGAGCVITWQEDPEGLRPGQGEGPGEGWSGAVAESQTDVWYAYISWEHFNLVEDPTDETGATIITLAEYEVLAAENADITQKPQVGIPFAMPMRVIDNARCNVENPQPYCWGSAEALPAKEEGDLDPLAYGMVDMCADTVEIPTGPQGTLSAICVTEYGLPLVGNIASTRPRVGLFGYDSDNDDIADSGFVIFQAEESKGLGRFGFIDGAPCDPDAVEGCIAFDEGKNMWYHSFNMELTGDAAGNYADKTNLDSLIANLGGHGNMLNQPEVDWITGEFYPVRDTADMWDFGDYNYEIWNTEIARRASLMAQDIKDVSPVGGLSKAKAGLLAMPMWKQGIMQQGGPADTMLRRIIIPRGWNPNNPNVGNPYAFRNMTCDNWLYGRGRDGMPENPFYPDGLCVDSATNLSGYIPDSCINSSTGESVECPQVDLSQGTTFGVGDTNPILQGNLVEPNQTKVLTWRQCPSSFTTVSSSDGLEVLTCETDLRTDASTLQDQSWYNPLDVSKGHRGFLDGDFVMVLYAWSPNWRTNAVGNDRYELYIRRSFDGGETWTTLPSGYKHADGTSWDGAGTVTCETFRTEETGGGDIVEPHVCNEYAAGAAEQARNVTQHKSMRTTTLDPRFAMSGSPRGESITADPFGVGIFDPDGEDLRNPSRYFIIYETGDNTTAEFGEPEPLDLFYGRAVFFGDHYQVWAEETDLTVCYPSDPHEVEVPEEIVGSGFCNEFDQMETGRPDVEASEASIEANPSGTFMYGVWAQFDHPNEESDAAARRVWYIDDYISLDNAWDLPGTSQGQ